MMRMTQCITVYHGCYACAVVWWYGRPARQTENGKIGGVSSQNSLNQLTQYLSHKKEPTYYCM